MKNVIPFVSAIGTQLIVYTHLCFYSYCSTFSRIFLLACFYAWQGLRLRRQRKIPNNC